ncbi:MAG: gamma-glutamyltransferase [Elusimicrobia bacterium]|nr:gamma-glutamyltransferase [Elusimicrobiota bacterium]
MKRLLPLLVLAAACAGPKPRAEAPRAWGLDAAEFVVAADHPAASAAGARILAGGGSVVDAAAATSLALAVVRPYSAGLGGGGFMLLKLAGSPPAFLDYRESAPAAAEAEAYLGADGLPIPGRTETGPWAVGVPGYLRGVPAVLARHGTMPLAKVLAPAIALAEDGVAVDSHMREAMEDLAARLAAAKDPVRYADIARIFLKDGKPYAVGDILRQPELAASLRRIAEKGAEDFFSGPFTEGVLAAAGPEAGGPMAREDLESYEAVPREPLAARFRGASVIGAPPPSSGGACLAEMLAVLDGFSPRALRRPAGAHLVVEAMKHAFADRARLLGDPDAHPEVEENVKAMLAPRRVKELRRGLGTARTLPQDSYGVASLPDDAGTTHYVVMDSLGNAVSATETINHFFGSLLVARGTGIVLNNELDDFAVSTSVPNGFGLRQSALNLIGPGRRPLSSMSPTLVLDKGAPVLAAGGSGGPRIITGVLQAVLGVMDGGLTPDLAVAAPRLHHQWSPDAVYVDAGVGAEVRAVLEDRGHALRPAAGEAAVQLVVKDGPVLRAASDPRKGGRPDGR